MQLISLTSMEAAVSFHADAVRDEQGKILHAIQQWSSEKFSPRLFAGSTAPESSNGSTSGYREEEDVPPIPKLKLSSHEAADRQLAVGRCSVICARENVWPRRTLT